MSTTWVNGKLRHGYSQQGIHLIRCCDGRKTYLEAVAAEVTHQPVPEDKASAKRLGYCIKCWEVVCRK